jgi:hypothetical protein
MAFESPIRFNDGTTVGKLASRYPARCSAAMALVGVDIATTAVALQIGGGESNVLFSKLFAEGLPLIAFASEIIVFLALLYVAFLFVESEFKVFNVNWSKLAGHFMFCNILGVLALTAANNCWVVSRLLPN